MWIRRERSYSRSAGFLHDDVIDESQGALAFLRKQVLQILGEKDVGVVDRTKLFNTVCD